MSFKIKKAPFGALLNGFAFNYNCTILCPSFMGCIHQELLLDGVSRNVDQACARLF